MTPSVRFFAATVRDVKFADATQEGDFLFLFLNLDQVCRIQLQETKLT